MENFERGAIVGITFGDRDRFCYRPEVDITLSRKRTFAELFDHLVGAQQYGIGDFDFQRGGHMFVYDEFELAGLFDE